MIAWGILCACLALNTGSIGGAVLVWICGSIGALFLD